MLRDPDALVHLARIEHSSGANLQLEMELYKRGLENFVLHVPSWLGLTEIYHEQGKNVQGRKSLAFIQEFAKNSADLAWSKAILANALGQEKIMTDNLLWLVKNRPGKRLDVLSLAELTWEDPLIIMNKFGSMYYMDILDMYKQNNSIEKTWTVWGRIAKEHKNTPKGAVKYVDFLLSHDEFKRAVKIWTENVNKEKSLLYNGNFENQIIGSGFGWKITSEKGALWEESGFGNGLEIRFDGTENEIFQMSQTVPLSPGKYIFSGTYETDNLTTNQRPFWQILPGKNCSELETEQPMMVPSSAQQTEFLIRFSVPESCNTVQIGLYRNRSNQADNKISGLIIVNSLKINQTESFETDLITSTKKTNRNSSAVNKSQETRIKINKLEVWP